MGQQRSNTEGNSSILNVPTSLDLLEGELTIIDKFGVICGTFTHQNDTSNIINQIETIHENKYNVTGSVEG